MTKPASSTEFLTVPGEYVARMEDVLDLYAEAPDPKRPVVCFDESPVQLIGEVRQPIPAEPGQLERYDYEYRRNGTVNLFVCLDVNQPWRKVKVTARRAAEDYAQCMRELVDVHFPDADCIRVVQDNLSTHSAGALYEAFAPAEARPFCGAWSSTTPPNTPVGSTWSRSRSASCAVSVWTAKSTTRIGSQPKSLHGNNSATLPVLASNGVHDRQSPSQNGSCLSRHIQKVIITVQRYQVSLEKLGCIAVELPMLVAWKSQWREAGS